MIDNDEKRIKALGLYDVGEVWGIGRRYAEKLERIGVSTALDFAGHKVEWVRMMFKNIVIERTWNELNGIDCVPDDLPARKKSICTSRSFDGWWATLIRYALISPILPSDRLRNCASSSLWHR